uniref:Kazal-like domain-containing protein n=1 Tax=Xenopus tropicalis TaxID=8364 RepID=A0A6I8PX38_XENTR
VKVPTIFILKYLHFSPQEYCSAYAEHRTCTKIYSPVCGTNRITYPNMCPLHIYRLKSLPILLCKTAPAQSD